MYENTYTYTLLLYIHVSLVPSLVGNHMKSYHKYASGNEAKKHEKEQHDQKRKYHLIQSDHFIP